MLKEQIRIFEDSVLADEIERMIQKKYGLSVHIIDAKIRYKEFVENGDKK